MNCYGPQEERIIVWGIPRWKGHLGWFLTINRKIEPVQRPSWERAPPVGSEGKKAFVAGAPGAQAPGAEARAGEIIWSQNKQRLSSWI